MTDPHPQPRPGLVDYLECARMDIRGNSYISGDNMVVDMEDVDTVINTLKKERAIATHTPAAPATERLGSTEFCYVHCDKHECCTNECERSAYDAAKAEREQVLDEIQQHALKAGFVRYDNKGKICNYTYINPKRLLKKIESLRGGGAP